jgi:hypothetical protein
MQLGIMFACFNPGLRSIVQSPRTSASQTPVSKIAATTAMPMPHLRCPFKPQVTTSNDIATVAMGLRRQNES